MLKEIKKACFGALWKSQKIKIFTRNLKFNNRHKFINIVLTLLLKTVIFFFILSLFTFKSCYKPMLLTSACLSIDFNTSGLGLVKKQGKHLLRKVFTDDLHPKSLTYSMGKLLGQGHLNLQKILPSFYLSLLHCKSNNILEWYYWWKSYCNLKIEGWKRG